MARARGRSVWAAGTVEAAVDLLLARPLEALQSELNAHAASAASRGGPDSVGPAGGSGSSLGRKGSLRTAAPGLAARPAGGAGAPAAAAASQPAAAPARGKALTRATCALPLTTGDLRALGLSAHVRALPGFGTLFFLDADRLHACHQGVLDWLVDAGEAGPFHVDAMEGHRALARAMVPLAMCVRLAAASGVPPAARYNVTSRVVGEPSGRRDCTDTRRYAIRHALPHLMHLGDIAQLQALVQVRPPPPAPRRCAGPWVGAAQTRSALCACCTSQNLSFWEKVYRSGHGLDLAPLVRVRRWWSRAERQRAVARLCEPMCSCSAGHGAPARRLPGPGGRGALAGPGAAGAAHAPRGRLAAGARRAPQRRRGQACGAHRAGVRGATR